MIRILVVDDSPTYRAFLARVFRADPDLVVVGEARTAYEAVAQAATLLPDVITLDLNMPGGDGMTVIRAVMEHAPVPIVVLSGAVVRGARALTMEALSAGAVEVLPKTQGDDAGAGEMLRRTVRAVAGISFRTRRLGVPPPSPRRPPVGVRAVAVGIAASTGGPLIVSRVLRALPAGFCLPVLVVQHIAPGMEVDFANWLNQESSLAVKVAEDGEALTGGTVYVARSRSHMVVRGRTIRLDDGPLVAGFRPSATVLFRSLAEAFGTGAAGIVLTGMGDDGADGLVAIRRAGGYTAAQSASECTVYGMPRSAVERGGAGAVLEVEDIAPALAALSPSPLMTGEV